MKNNKKEGKGGGKRENNQMRRLGTALKVLREMPHNAAKRLTLPEEKEEPWGGGYISGGFTGN